MTVVPVAAMPRTAVSCRTQVRNLSRNTGFLHAVEMTGGLRSRLVLKSITGRFLHAGRKPDVEMLDGKFAGDEAGEKQIPCTSQDHRLL